MKTTPRFHRAPTQLGAEARTQGPTPLPELSPARVRVLEAVAAREDAGRATTVIDLAEDLGGHPNTTRAHVGQLVSDSLLERVPSPAATRGRPARAHRLTDRGRLVLDAVRVAEPVTTDELVSAMAEHLSRTPDAEAHARAIGRLWAAQLRTGLAAGATAGRPSTAAGRLHEEDHVSPADRMLPLLRAAGFSPQPESSGDVALRTCPVLTSARAHPGVVCTMHEEMLRAALEGGDASDVEVALIPFAREGACLVRLRHR